MDDTRLLRNARKVCFEHSRSEAGVSQDDIRVSCRVAFQSARVLIRVSERTSGNFLQPIHRKAVRSLEKAATLFHLALHEFAIRQQLIWEVAVENDALPGKKTKCWDACGQLVHEVHVIGRCIGPQ